jgi:3-methyl-2-oxobutanoate hydroxymethyltransferase
MNVQDIIKKKNDEKIIMLTCYDYSFAHILDSAGVDILLVGDSLANVVLGLDQTRKVSASEMRAHTKAVASGSKNCLVVVDMPYTAYQRDPTQSLHYAHMFLKAGADAVKIEWFTRCLEVAEALRKEKIPVMGHIGLTPQTAHLLGGYKVQGKEKESAKNLMQQAQQLQQRGVFSLVLECIPWQLARTISQNLTIPTIGIGAGKYCDGQVLVLYDMLGLYPKRKARFVRMYSNLTEEVKKAVFSFKSDVLAGQFPAQRESYSADE